MDIFIKKYNLQRILFLIVSLLAFYLVYWQFGMLLFHTLIELSTVLIGIMMFIVAIKTKEFSRNNFLLFLGTGFLFIAILDLFHLLTVPGMAFFPDISIQTTLHFWIFARLFEGILLLISPIFFTKRLNETVMLFLGSFIVFAIFWISVSFEAPILITQEGLTPFKNNMEYFIIAILLVTAFLFYRRKKFLSLSVYNYLLSAIILGVSSEYSFTLYVDFQNTAFIVGHILKFISFICIYRAIIHTTLTEPFRQLSRVSNSYDVIPHPAIIVNSKGVIQSVNHAASQFIKFDHVEQLIGEDAHDYFHPQNVDKNKCLLCKAIKEHTDLNGDILEYPNSISNQWIEVYSEKVEVRMSDYLFLQLLIDVTENKLAFSKLKQTTQQLSYTQRNAHIGSWNLVFSTGQLWWSDEVYSIFEVDKNTTREHSVAFIEMTHPEDRKRVDKAFNDSVNQKYKYDVEYRLLMNDGRIKYVHEQCETIYDDAGKAIKSLGSVQDITSRNEMKEALIRNEKMDALGKLTGGVAHDFNNLLGVISGFSELLVKELKGNDELTKYADYINNAASRGADLTKKLLSFSKKNSTQVECININQLISSNEVLIKKTLTSQVDFITDLSPKLWHVQLNINEFDDVILNMCINSLHAMPNGGSLTITTANVNLSSLNAKFLDTKAGDYVVVTITDTGFGMSEEVKSKIFDPFFSTKADKGTGLGLSQAYGFVQSSSGAINVRSQIGVGSSFEMYFPRYTADKEVEKPSVISEYISENNLSGNETILVVDDEPALAEFARCLLQEYGYSVLVAESAKQALSILQDSSNEVELLISDIIMPEMNGYELVERVEKLYPEIRTLLASGFKGDIKNVYKGITIDKPFDALTLLSHVRQSIDSTNKLSTHNEHQSPKLLQLHWGEEMSLDDGGIIDQDHQRLIEFINKCHRMDRFKLLDDIFYEYIEELIQHMTEHFEYEERMMRERQYPFYKNHYDVHRLMVKQLLNISKYQNTQEIYQWIITDLSEWLSEHILGLDRAFISYSLQQKTKKYALDD